MSGSRLYTPHLKKVLKSYQAAATSSLQGPNSFMPIWSEDSTTKVTSSSSSASSPKETTSSKVVSKQPQSPVVDYDPFLAPPPFPIQQPPIFTPADRANCERSETLLDGETIACFTVGGEKRLCFPQILNTVLKDFSLQQINNVCDEMQIFCSRCTVDQLEVLKSSGDLPFNAPSCGLITKSDAERLSAALLETREPKTVLPKSEDGKRPFGFKIIHNCFGKTTGFYYPDYYSNPFAPCIECLQCKGMFSPKKFIRHVHNPKQNKTCHWGFESDNWRNYLILDTEAEDYEVSQEEHLVELKKKFDYTPPVKRKIQAEPSPPTVVWTGGDTTVGYWCPSSLQLPIIVGERLCRSPPPSSPEPKKIKVEAESLSDIPATESCDELDRIKALLEPLNSEVGAAILEEVNNLRLRHRQELEAIQHSERVLKKELEDLRPLKQQIVAEAKRRLKDVVLLRKDYITATAPSLVLVKQE